MAEENGKNTEDTTAKVNPADQKLIDAACKAYGIDPKYVLASRVDEEGRAVIVTHGGAKVKYALGDEKAKGFEPLGPVRVDGIIRKKMKTITGAKKKKD